MIPLHFVGNTTGTFYLVCDQVCVPKYVFVVYVFHMIRLHLLILYVVFHLDLGDSKWWFVIPTTKLLCGSFETSLAIEEGQSRDNESESISIRLFGRHHKVNELDKIFADATVFFIRCFRGVVQEYTVKYMSLLILPGQNPVCTILSLCAQSAFASV
jgi:hypothetical protein